MKFLLQVSSCIKLPMVMRLLLAVLLSKFYFLWGYPAYTHLPAAPVAIVLIRDLILFVFLGFLIAKIQWKKIAFDGHTKALIALGIVGIIIAILHLSMAKSLQEVAQHYFRNLLIPILTFPLFYFYLETNTSVKDKIADHIHKVLLAFGAISLLLSYAQLFFWPSLMWETRPTGILGDPLLNSCFLLIMVWALFKTENSPTTRVVVIGITGFVLFSGSSISAIVAYLMAIFFTTLKSGRYSDPKALFTKRNILGFIFIGCLVAVLFSSLHRQLKLSNGVDEKIRIFWTSLSCGDECEPDPSIRGRIASYKFTYNLCKNDLKACALGAYQSNRYYRLDSTFASIIANCGIIFSSIYVFIFLIVPLFFIKRPSIIKYNLDLLFGIFVLYWAFGIFNTSIYKYPLNILFYVVLAVLISLNRKEKAS